VSAKPLPTPALITAVGIGRVSLLKQVGNYSIAGQNHKLATLAEKFKFRIPEGFLLDDEGYSGTDFNRPSIRQALQMIRAGEANAVVFPYVDRFARNMEGGSPRSANSARPAPKCCSVSSAGQRTRRTSRYSSTST
jgi:hypothetical protein